MEQFSTLGFQLECGLRLLAAAGCGLSIGYERKNRLKEAGIRTHMIVAIGAALMMIVSKYGFFDLAGAEALIKVDASRIASQVVSGIGFLGAGMIFTHNRNVTGLTTAAGVWTTAGIGMAIGAGMYVLGLTGAALVLLTQWWSHRSGPGNLPDTCSLLLRLREEDGSVSGLIDTVQSAGGQMLELSVMHKKKGLLKLAIRLRLPPGMPQYELVERLEKEPFVVEVEH